MRAARRAEGPVAIVGGGIAGLSLAYALARRRCDVVLFERGRVGRQGASSGPAALLNPLRGRSARAHPDDVAGLAAFWRVADELRAMGFDPAATRTGALRIAPDERRARAWSRLPYGRWLPAGEVPPAYRAPHGALLAEDGGWVRPRSLLAALRGAAEALGAQVREGVRVLRVEPTPHAVHVVTSAGAVPAARLVLCVGADRSPGLPLPPLTYAAGDVVRVPLAPLPLRPRLPLGGPVYAAFDQDDAYVGGGHRDPDVPDSDAPKRLLARLDRCLPGIGSAIGTSLWGGVRAQGPSPRPVVADTAERVTFLGALAGRGFLVSASLASALAERLAP